MYSILNKLDAIEQILSTNYRSSSVSEVKGVISIDLILAAEQGNLQKLQEAYEKGSDLKYIVSEDGQPILNFAVDEMKWDIVVFLMEVVKVDPCWRGTSRKGGFSAFERFSSIYLDLTLDFMNIKDAPNPVEIIPVKIFELFKTTCMKAKK